jgi:hypothetical protein
MATPEANPKQTSREAAATRAKDKISIVAYSSTVNVVSDEGAQAATGKATGAPGLKRYPD